MPAKDMKQFLHDFFNPPKFAQPVEAKRRAAKKKAKKKLGLSPIQRQLQEADEFMKYKIKEYEACTTGRLTTLLPIIQVQLILFLPWKYPVPFIFYFVKIIFTDIFSLIVRVAN
jgi:hypothetical protein